MYNMGVQKKCTEEELSSGERTEESTLKDAAQHHMMMLEIKLVGNSSKYANIRV